MKRWLFGALVVVAAIVVGLALLRRDRCSPFDRRYPFADAGGEIIDVAVRFDFTATDRVPCASLALRVEQFTRSWIANAPVDELRRDPRGTGEAAAASLKRELTAFHPQALTVRLRVPHSARVTLPVAGIASLSTKTKPVIFIGLDGADWQLLDAFMRAGSMPNLQSLVREGIAGELLTEHPPLSPLLWTTMMTGASPLEHEILDFTRFHPVTGAKEPITSDERKLPAIWNMATQAGKSVAVFGLWATYPPEPVRGVVVSDRFFTATETVYPSSRQAWARKVRADVEKQTDLAKYGLAHAAGGDPYSDPVSALRRILIDTATYDRLAREYFAETRPDLTILYVQGTDSIGHIFAPYTPPRQAHISEADFARYSNIPALYFREIDRLLGEYKALAQKYGARLMIASDHGFHWFEDRPAELSSFAAGTAAKWHRNAGVYVLWGEGIVARGRTGPQQHIAQVAPTLLALAGMPNSADLTASPIFVPGSKLQVDYRKHFVPMKPVATQPANEELAKLKALGYIGADEATSAPAGSTRTSGWYSNRGLILKERKQYDDAIAAFEQAVAIDPNHASALWNYSDLLLGRDRDRSDDLLVRALAGGLAEGRKHVIGRAITYQRKGDAARSLRLLEQAVAAKPGDPELRLFRGRYRLEAKDCAGALEDFRAVNSPLAREFAAAAEACPSSGLRPPSAH
ncbi:MAG TPA: alkaline phosphatase family protein [Thermoanaerobaculia bacterium]|nr:alkaline phosphatase family protein [Thermoanaerobaculia bacterium]